MGPLVDAKGVGLLDDACGVVAGDGLGGASDGGWLGFFTNNGNYMPRIECLQTASGGPDWPWIITLGVLTSGVVIAYARIFVFWLRGYLHEAPIDRNRKLMDLANIFLWCAVCGYAMSLVMFVWPAYRLLAIFLLVLNIWSWRFTRNLRDLSVSFSARRLQRELKESIEERNRQLELQVSARTAELEQMRREAERANESKSRFLAMMSHELRTPLTAILGYAELLEHAGDTQRADYSRTISRHGEHLLSVINDILDLSKLEAGRMTVERVPFSPTQTLADVVALFRARAAEKGVELGLEVEVPLPEMLLSDPTRLKQCVMNLVSNAIKFTEAGRVTVCASWSPSAAASPGGTLTIEVSDTGIGLSAEALAGLFRPFAQADCSTTRRYGGTGMGLFITRRLATLLGGDVVGRSVEGSGSWFTITLPLERATLGLDPAVSEEAGRAGVARDALSGRRILVADDGEDNRRLFAHHLRRAGAIVELACDGREALELVLGSEAQSRPLDLVLLDIHMPNMDGREVASALRQSGYVGRVAAITADAMVGAREEGLLAGFDDYITKPITGTLLVMRAREICQMPVRTRAWGDRPHVVFAGEPGEAGPTDARPERAPEASEPGRDAAA
jgi:signal transduction histidine kinase/CheY-like chemotaxis protein